MSYVSSSADSRRQAQRSPCKNRGVLFGSFTILCDIAELCNAFDINKSRYYLPLIASDRNLAIPSEIQKARPKPRL